jgi:hypothetical protein
MLAGKDWSWTYYNFTAEIVAAKSTTGSGADGGRISRWVSPEKRVNVYCL